MGSLEQSKQKLAEMQAQLKDWNAFREKGRRERKEAGERQIALDWLRRTIFPVFEGIAQAQNFPNLKRAAEYVVSNGIRLDGLLADHWNSPEAQGFFDSVAGRLLLVASAQLLNEPDETTAGRALWLLQRVLPYDDRGDQIAEMYAKMQGGPELWQQTIVGVKKVIASRLPR